ncbi:unnamed protein product [Ilex paraguariensis]|uniref:FCP1 homology domain-containing protein n=1 Tax=Ilex paraguariensis TaxID=185542 RepID=A0ABC8R5T4_9AQUA
MISKNSLSRVKISQKAAENETCIPNIQDGSLCKSKYDQDIGTGKTNHMLDGGNCQYQKQPLPLINSETVGRMESTPATSNLETIFSTLLESMDVHGELHFYVDEGSDKHIDVPQLVEDNDADSGGSSCEYQACNVSEFNISDMILSGLPIEDNSIYDYIPDTACLPDYKCDEPSMFFNVAEECMMLPFLEDTTETSNGHDNETREESIIKSDDSSLYLAIHQLRSCNQDSDVNFCTDSDEAEFFDPHMFIRNLPDLPDVSPSFRPTLLPKETRKVKSVTLVLDLDETLVHSTLEYCNDADFTFSVVFNMKEHTVYVKQRPYLRTFLERVAEKFEIAIFTASQSIYAKQLLDILDPDGKIISRRAYRESCIFSDGNYTKDLTILGVDLAKVAIIDNSPQVFQLQVNNGIPIRSWFDDPSDCALISLLPFLGTLVDADDVRPIIAKRFGNKE